MSTRTLKFELEAEVEVAGEEPHINEITDKMIGAMNQGMPSVAFHDDEASYEIFVNSWQYTAHPTEEK